MNEEELIQCMAEIARKPREWKCHDCGEPMTGEALEATSKLGHLDLVWCPPCFKALRERTEGAKP